MTGFCFRCGAYVLLERATAWCAGCIERWNRDYAARAARPV